MFLLCRFFVEEVFLRHLDDDRRQGDQGDEVRDSHQAVEGIGDIPNNVDGGNGADDDNYDIQCLVDGSGLQTEQVLEAA